MGIQLVQDDDLLSNFAFIAQERSDWLQYRVSRTSRAKMRDYFLLSTFYFYAP